MSPLPGARLRSWARRVCRPQTMERLVDPMLADLQAEWRHEQAAGRPWRARWAYARACVELVTAVSMHAVLSGVRPLEAPDRPRHAAREGAMHLMVDGVAMLVATVVTATTAFRGWWRSRSWPVRFMVFGLLALPWSWQPLRRRIAELRSTLVPETPD